MFIPNVENPVEIPAEFSATERDERVVGTLFPRLPKDPQEPSGLVSAALRRLDF
jgi:hypothetical protein